MQVFRKAVIAIVSLFIISSLLSAGCGGGGGGGSTSDNLTGNTTVNYTLALSVSPSSLAGTVAASPNAAQYASGSVVTLITAAATGYKFKEWGGTNSVEVVGGKITMNGNKSVIAVFETSTTEVPVTPKYTLSLSVSPSATAGTVTASPSAASYDSGTAVTLSATPATGYKFKSFGGANGTDVVNNVITMNANKTVTAVFEALPVEVPVTKYTLTLSISPSATSGTATATPAGPAYDAGTVVTLSYNAYLGNKFSKWDGTNSVDVVSDKITMNANKAVTAVFESSSAATAKAISVDASNDLGAFKTISGANDGPVALVSGSDLTSKYRDLGFKTIRTLDYYGPCTWYNIFPDFTKDPELESSYDFSTTDVKINKLVAEGFDILFNFAPSWDDPVFKNTADPPGTIRDASGNVTHAADINDFKKFANVCKHIVMHYNAGWKNGYNYNIKKWEIWNEPETVDHFWTGTAIQFFQMFSEVAKTLKTYNSGLMICGPANAQMYSATYTTNLLSYCQTNQVPIDVFTWHCYGGADKSPSELKKYADDIRTKLNTYGYNSTLSACTEWNSGLGAENFADSGKGAAYYGSTCSLIAENDLYESYVYRGDDHPLGIIKNSTGEYKTGTYALIAWKQMTDSCTRLGSSTTETGDFKVTASKKSADGSYYALVSNFTTENKSVKLNISNISTPPANGWTVTRKVITDTKKLSTEETGTVASDNNPSYAFTIPSYTVAFIQFSPK